MASRAVMISTGRVSPPRRIAAQHIEPGLSGQPEIEHQRVVHALGQRGLRGPAILDPVDGEAVLREAAPHAGPDHRIVFGEQERASSRGRCSAPAHGAQSFGSNLSDAEFMQ